MPFGLMSAWNKRRRSKSEDHINPWIYKPVEYWQLEDQIPPSDHLPVWILGIGEVKMDWPLRLKVALGAARGLAHLHSTSAVGIPIVHRDLKSTNILLNTDYEQRYQILGLQS